jgi:replication factor A1
MQLNECIVNLVQNRKVCICLNVQVHSNPGVKIGNPVALDENGMPTGVPHQGSGSPAGQHGGYPAQPPPPQPYPAAAADPHGYAQQQQQQFGAAPPQQQYGAPPAQQYGAPPHQQPYGAPPAQQQYGQPQWQQPPPGQQQQQPPSYAQQQMAQWQQQPPGQQGGGYGQLPPQQGGYGQPPQQQGGYGQPPPGLQQGGYGQPPQQQGGYGAPPPSHGAYGGGGAVQRDNASVIMPISALNPYQNKWTIRGRLMDKGERSYSNAKGDGKLFNLTVTDSTCDIRVTGFTETYNEHYAKLVTGRVYQISGGTLKPKNERYNQTKHGFEITLNRGCTIDECDEPDGPDAIPKYSFDFIPSIAHLESLPDESKADVLGVIAEISEPNTFTAKSGKEMTKRVMILADSSGRTIECTIFGQPTHSLSHGTVIGIKGAKVGSWNTKSLTLWDDAPITPHPDMPAAHQLSGWWQAGGSAQPMQPISMSGGGGNSKPARRIVFSDIDDQALGLNSEPDYFNVRCTITHIKSGERTLWYIACPDCKKKLASADEDNLTAHCEKCDKTTQGTRRWIFQATANDATGSRFVSLFDDQAVPVLGGKTADEMALLRSQNQAAFDAHFILHSFKSYNMKCRVKNETYMEEQKLKVSAVTLQPIDWLSEGRTLLQEIYALQ